MMQSVKKIMYTCYLKIEKTRQEYFTYSLKASFIAKIWEVRHTMIVLHASELNNGMIY